MPPKQYRRKRGGNPYRRSQVLRRESDLPAQDEGLDRDQHGNLRSRRPPEPKGPPPRAAEGPVREVVTTSAVHLRATASNGVPGTLLEGLALRPFRRHQPGTSRWNRWCRPGQTKAFSRHRPFWSRRLCSPLALGDRSELFCRDSDNNKF